MKWVVLLALAGCGSKSEPKPAPSVPSPEAGAPVADAGVLDAAPAAALPTCTDGGGLAGAAVIGDEVRFCLDEGQQRKSCWGVGIASAVIEPLASDRALDGATPLAIQDDGDPDGKPGSWSAKTDHDKVEVCEAGTCRPLALVLPSKDPDDDRAAVSDVAISATGNHVAVLRGIGGVSAQTLEVYDRASGTRLGVAKPKTGCVDLQGFANETVVATEWDCANKGGDRVLVAPSGKLLARIARLSTAGDPFAQLAGDVWAFSETHTGSIEIYDVASGRRLGGRELAQFAPVAVHAGRAIAIEPEKARVYVFDKTGAEIATARVPTCRYEWENEAIGPLRLLQPVEEVAKAIGAPTNKSKPDVVNMHTATWTYVQGVTAVVRPNYVSDVTGRPVPPWFVVGIRLGAPSKHQINGAGIGSTLDELKKAFGAREVKSKTSDTLFVAGNEADGGIQFTLVAGQVTRIEIGEVETLDASR